MQAHHVNFRYILLEDGSQFFLVDKLPTLLGYFFPYLNWFGKRRVYRLTEEQFWAIRTRKKHWLETLAVPSSSAILVAVLAGRIRLGENVVSYLSFPRFLLTERWIVLFLCFLIAVVLGRTMHFLSARAFQRKFDFAHYQEERSKVKLIQFGPWLSKLFFVVFMLNVLIFVSTLLLLLSGTLFSLMIHGGILFMCILVAGDLSYSEGCQYKIGRIEEK